MKCAMLDDNLAGVVVSYPTSQMQAVDKLAGQGFMKALGFFNFIKKLLFYMKMDKMLTGNIDPDGLYIHTLCVNSDLRGQGIGSEITHALAQENGKMYLYVNAANDKAISFYKKTGFEEAAYGEMQHRGKTYGEFLMARN
jgi:ribosomal protein S18 acetylase RimI-like enzyme